MPHFFRESEYRKIADSFHLGKMKNIVYFRKGFQAPKVMVDTPRGKFIISRYNPYRSRNIVVKSKVSIQYEIDLLNLISDLPVPHHIKFSDNKFITEFNKSLVTVYEYLPGNPPQKITPKMAGQLGQFLGKFHSQGKKFRKKLIGRRQFYCFTPSVIEKTMKYAKNQSNSKLKSVVQEIKTGVEHNRPPERLPKGPIHVDIKPENELFVGQKLSGILDFGNFYIGQYMVDVGKTIMWNCVSRGSLNSQLVKSFLDGYERERQLNREECAYLRSSILFAIYSHIFVDLYHVPLKYVPESYTLFLVRRFLPVAHSLEKQDEIL